MGLRVIDCVATPAAVTVYFSDAVNEAAEKAGNYSITDVAAAELLTPSAPSATYDPVERTVSLTGFPVVPGTWYLLKVDGAVKSASQMKLEADGDQFAMLATGERRAGRKTRAVEDATTYPLLTEDVGTSKQRISGGPPPSPAGGEQLGAVAAKVIGDVLGWKVKDGDSKAFVGALTASFTGREVEGRWEYDWKPRAYALQTDLSGGISGAQASLFTMAKDVLDQALPAIDELYALDVDADEEDVAALKGIVRGQLTELVNELGLLGGPRVPRVEQYFRLLLVNHGGTFPPLPATDPDLIGGTLGKLRHELGLRISDDFINTIAHEENASRFRIAADRIIALAQVWINNRKYFGLGAERPFFGTQLVHLQRQLSVVAESVDDLRVRLDSVFIGPAERQTSELRFPDQPLFLEDLLSWIQSFVTDEAPRLIQDGGKFGVSNTFHPVAAQLAALVKSATGATPVTAALPHGFHTPRVQRALEELGDELHELVKLTDPIRHVISTGPTDLVLEDVVREMRQLKKSVQSITKAQRSSSVS